jgi:hypothetical protein
VTIISGDKAKTQAYCDIRKLSEQIEEASAKKDSKTVEELSLKIETLEKALGPEYVALVDGLPDILGNDLLGANLWPQSHHSTDCVRDKSRKSEKTPVANMSDARNQFVLVSARLTMCFSECAHRVHSKIRNSRPF